MSPGTKFQLPLPLDLGVCGISKKPSPIVVSATFFSSPLMILNDNQLKGQQKMRKDTVTDFRVNTYTRNR